MSGYSFELPVGVVDELGNHHRKGVMRGARAIDEVEALGEPKVRRNPGYLGIAVMSRVVERIGDIAPVPTELIEQLLVIDFQHLQQLYEDINGGVSDSGPCPKCGWEHGD